MKRCIIFANGRPPKKSVINYLRKVGAETLICADGGANFAHKLGLIPDFIIGDLDSIHSKILKAFNKKSRIINYKRQNDTDVEKSIKFAISKKFDEVFLVGATGDRLDHTFCNLGIVIKFSEKINIKIIHEQSLLALYSGKVELKTTPGEIISLYGFDRKTKFFSKGLKYPLDNSSLPFGEKESTSNVAVAEKVNLQIRNGKGFVIRQFDVLKRNGFFH